MRHWQGALLDRSLQQPPATALAGQHLATVGDEVLGRFVRGSQPLPGGGRSDDPFFSRNRRLGDRTVVLLLGTGDRVQARRLLPRLRRAVEDSAVLQQRAVEAVVHRFSTTPPTEEELTQSHADLLLDTIVVDDEREVVLHLNDPCGEHIMDGYWPAVRFDAQNQVADVTIET